MIETNIFHIKREYFIIIEVEVICALRRQSMNIYEMVSRDSTNCLDYVIFSKNKNFYYKNRFCNYF